jgi:hypothetical protein
MTDLKFAMVLACAMALCAAPAMARKVQQSATPDSVAAPAAQTDDGSPEAAVRALYSPYLPGGNENMSAFDNEGERAKRFSADLVKQMKAYFKNQEKAGEPGGLDFDPIVNGQDYKIDRLTVKTDKLVASKTAIIIAEFKNFDETARLKYKLAFENGTWRVDNIVSLKDPIWDLRDLLKGE